ncbi:hypothetical protein [Micromonospora sp. IBHARD004]
MVDRTFGWLVHNRRLAHGFDHDRQLRGMITIAMMRLMTIRLAGRTVR